MVDGTSVAPVSVLYVPAHKTRAIAKARTLSADMIVLDLEDAVPCENKAEARDTAIRAIGEGFSGKRVALRVNRDDTDDLAAAALACPDFIIMPKVDGPGDLPACDCPLMAMIETPQGVLACADIAADRRVVGLIAGLNDLAFDLQLPAGVDRDVMGHCLQTIVLGARSGNAWCFDGVCNTIDDAEAFEREVRQGYRLGFDGKTLIHPSQIDICNRIWMPNAAALAKARRVVEAAATGAVRFEGGMIEAMHVAAAQRIIARADLRRSSAWVISL